MHRPIFLLLVPALTLLLATPLARAEERGAQPESFATFWMGFKGAVAKNDREAVVAATDLPSLPLTKAAFLQTYPKIFTKQAQKCFVAAKPVRTPDRDSYSVFCGSQMFYFERIKGSYKFTSYGPND